jgi:hypothetical protein
MPAKDKIVTEVKILFSAAAGDCVRESSAQNAPMLCTLLPRRNFGHLEARHCDQEWSCEVRPPRIAVEVCAMK